MESEKRQRIYKTIMLVVLTAAITFIITTITMYNTLGGTGTKYVTTTGTSSSIGKTFEYFRNFIEKNYIGEIDETAMIESAIKGYIDGLGDDYSEYITSDEMTEYMQETNGNYVGIGVYIANNTATNQIVILMPIKGSPAEEVGILPGDIITKIDGVEYKGEELTQASNHLKQEEGTKVRVEVLRDGETIEFEIERRSIKVNHIETEVLENNIGYIEISTFDDGCYEEFIQKYEELKKQNVKSLIIDLRNNGGGIVDQAINIADTMVDKDKTLLITSSKSGGEEIKKAKIQKMIDLPIVILINENTASSSEILTAALRENLDSVTTVGKTTYGKGVIQTIFSLTDGSGLKLTTNEYYTPNRNTINKVGITPDIEVDLPDGKTLYTIEENEDTQLQKAIELLK